MEDFLFYTMSGINLSLFVLSYIPNLNIQREYNIWLHLYYFYVGMYLLYIAFSYDNNKEKVNNDVTKINAMYKAAFIIFMIPIKYYQDNR